MIFPLSKSTPAQGSSIHLQQNLTSTSLVVIDAGLVDTSALVSDLSTANTNVLLLSVEQDGVSQIADALREQPQLSSLHIVSHGSPGRLHLGNSQLSLETLDEHASALSVWAEKLADADMLLYGCQVAKGALGHLFLQQLRQLTGANIAAAEKRIGRVGYNTNWNLDTQLGEVKTPLIFSEALQASYPSHFEPVVDFSINTDTVIESEGTPVVFNFSLSEPPPEGGTVIRWEGSIPQAINQLDLFALNVQGLADLPVDVSAAGDFSAFEITIIEQNASISLPGFNDFRDDSPQEITWTISPVSGGTVGNSSATFTIYDDASEVPANPTPPDLEPPTPPAPTEPAVSLSADQTTLVEDEGTEVTLTINLSEPPPEGGVQIEIVTGKPFALGDFDIFPPPPQATSTGGRIVRGLDDNSGFIFNVTEQTATISLPIFDDADRPASDPNSTRNDDIGEEQTTFSIAAGDGYSVSSNSAVTLTLKDTNQVAPPPNPTPDPLTIGLSADPTALVEEDGTATTLTFTLSEAPPEGGITVTIDSDIPASLAEFNVNAANFSGVQLVGANDDASGFTVLITDQVATIQLPVFDDDLDEGLEEITYSLQAGEGYEIDGAAGSTTLSITDSDAVVTPPANTAPVANNDSYSTAADSPLTVAAGEGVLVGDTDADGDSLVATFVGNPDNGSVEFAEDGSFTYTPNAGFVGTDSFTYQASDGQDSSEVATVTIEVGENTPPPTGGDAPVVSFSVTPGVVSEAEGTNLVMNFAVDGDIPPEGITVKLEGDAARIMQQFTAAQTRFDPDTGEIFYRFDRSLVEGNVVGGELGLFSLVDGNPAEGLSDAAAAGDAFLSDFTFKITAANASITLPVFDDIIEEEDATLTYTLVEGEGYSVDSTANTGTFTVTDGVAGGVGPTVGVTASPVMLVESDQTVATVTFNTVGDIPPEGVVVQLAGMPRAIAEFDVNATNPRLPEAETVIEGVTVAGGSIVGTDNVAGSLFFRITDPTATISVPVFQDDVAEGTENLTFNLLDGEAYEVDDAASEVSFSIEDGEGDGNGGDPSVVTDSDSVSTNNDIIASAQTIDLSADNPLVKVQASISQRFEDRNNTVDGTEDVDMFEVTLKAGDRITIDADSITTNLDGFQVGPAPDLTIFNAAGEKIVVGTDEDGEDIFAVSSQDGAPDEAFVAGRDAYLDFTATEDGTYYIGASQHLNNSYDPNVVGSGSGAFFGPSSGVGPGGEYTLDIALNPEGFDGEVYEAFTGTPNAGAPVVSLLTDAGTFTRAENRDDIVVASELIESGDAGRGTLGISFNVEGDIPEGGLEVLIKNDQGVDLNDYFEGLSSSPRIVVGGTLTGGLYSADGALIGFKALLTANNAFFPFTASANDQDDPNAPETFTFSLANSADYVASEGANSSEVTIYDDLAQVPVNSGPRPEVGLTFDTTEFIESEGTEGTLTFTVNGDIPEGGLQVYVDSEDSLLGEFDVFNAEVSGGGFPSPSGNASGFFFRVFENTATIKLTVFDETTNDQIPAEDALEGIEAFSLSIQPLDSYTINASAASVDFTIKDNPDSVVIPDSGEGEGGEEPTGPIDTDSNDTINDTLDTAVDTGLTADNNTVTIDGDIALRRRNPDEQKADNTEDVDIYSFELAAGQKVNIGADSVPFELNGITQNTTPTLRLFNAAGEELALSATTVENGAVTDVAALEYTADAAGTYYVGVSQYLNDNYDPMVNASGDGVQLIEDGISPGAYQLDLVLSAGDDNGGGNGGMMPDIVGTDAGEILIGNDEKNIIDALGGDDTVAGGLEDDIISGGDGDDVLRGDRNARSTQNGQIGGNDIIFGGNGNDRIGGKGGNDVLSGDAGDDFIWGDDGDDIIMGVTGNDILVGDNFSGGSGSDLFVFGNGDGTDTILDFEVGTDRIGLVSGELSFADLTITQDGNNTLLGISSSNETIAVLNNVQASALTESSFAVVSDVSNPEEALQLI